MLYDPEADIICLEVGKGKITHAREFGNLIVHLSDSAKPILIEILEASKLVGRFDKIKNTGDLKRALSMNYEA